MPTFLFFSFQNVCIWFSICSTHLWLYCELPWSAVGMYLHLCNPIQYSWLIYCIWLISEGQIFHPYCLPVVTDHLWAILPFQNVSDAVHSLEPEYHVLNPDCTLVSGGMLLHLFLTAFIVMLMFWLVFRWYVGVSKGILWHWKSSHFCLCLGCKSFNIQLLLFMIYNWACFSMFVSLFHIQHIYADILMGFLDE